MTLIANELHILNGFKKTIWVFAADRRISKPGGSFDCVRRKVFPIPYFDGGVSYFGRATVLSKGHQQYLADWLPDFINKQHDASTLRDFAFNLRDALHKIIPPATLKASPSGFHIAGYSSDGIPEFWFLSNIGSMDQYRYGDLQGRYANPTPDLLGRDAKAAGWDGVNPMSVSNGVQVYRNGDIRAHVSSWERLDKTLVEMSGFQDMRKLKTAEDLARWVRFKFKFIAAFYKDFARHQIISTPIDVFCTSRGL